MKVHPVYENYLVSMDGGVMHRKNLQVLKPQYKENGYIRYEVHLNGTRSRHNANRLVLETYRPIENSELYHAHHKNHIRDDNRLENLEWILISEHIKMHRHS